MLKKYHQRKTAAIIIDALSIRKQTLWDAMKKLYSGFVNYGTVQPEDPETLDFEALVFMLVERWWKCPITAKTQAELVRMAFEKAADVGLRVWPITADGTSIKISMFTDLGCKFSTTYDSMVTMFRHPLQNCNDYVILDPCHILKLNALVQAFVKICPNV